MRLRFQHGEAGQLLLPVLLAGGRLGTHRAPVPPFSAPGRAPCRESRAYSGHVAPAWGGGCLLLDGPASAPTGVFLGLGLSGVVPTMHFTIAEGFVKATTVGQMGWFFLMAVMYITGAGLYAARIPERFFPGKFDIWVITKTAPRGLGGRGSCGVWGTDVYVGAAGDQ